MIFLFGIIGLVMVLYVAIKSNKIIIDEQNKNDELSDKEIIALIQQGKLNDWRLKK